VPDVDWGERVRAIVVAKTGATIDKEEVMAYCKNRMASFKKPESVVVVEELPRNPLGKVLKRVLREKFSYPLRD
jgi:long-chain acyl-CoA synthetase